MTIPSHTVCKLGFMSTLSECDRRKLEMTRTLSRVHVSSNGYFCSKNGPLLANRILSVGFTQTGKCMDLKVLITILY